MTDPYELHAAYVRIFQTGDGQKIMKDLERRGFFNEPCFSAESTRHAFNEGRRSIVLHVRQMLDKRNFNRFKKDG